MDSFTRAAAYGSNVRIVLPVAGFVVEMLTVDTFDSLRVPQVSLGDPEARVARITQIHVLPRNLVGRIDTAFGKESPDGPHERPGRQSLDYGRCADEVRLHQAGLPVPLDAKLFDAANILAVDVANLRTEQKLDVDLHASLPPGVRRRGFAR
jgi:hypothetical protein